MPEPLRGTYAGLAHPAAIEHLAGLGVTAVELLPSQQFVTEPAVSRRGLSNYWGYNTIGYFAPHAAYAATPGEQVREFKAMVRALHAAGIEVILDVVYNHTAEGDETGPTLCFRGIDNAGYYRLLPDDPRRYADYTGCGNTLDVRHPYVLQMLMDSLRYWVTEMHVDGFRFDLASALARSLHDVDKLSAFFDVIHQDPVVSRVKLIAEPWDVGEGGYQVGEFPPLWTEWNGKYRDTVRSFWAGERIGVRDLGFRLTGSSDLYADDGRRPFASINFVTAHDGFTLRDLVSYEREAQRGQRRGQPGRRRRTTGPGTAASRARPTTRRSPRCAAGRRATCCCHAAAVHRGADAASPATRCARTQGGNNNAYCQDNEVSWVDWTGVRQAAAADLLALTRRLVALRRDSPVLRQRAFFAGRPVPGGARPQGPGLAAGRTGPR